MELFVEQLRLGPMQNFIYLVGANEAEEVAVIDPAWDADAIVEAAERHGKRIVAALLSHRHGDHINALEPLLSRLPSLRAYAQQAEIETSDVLRDFGDAITPVRPDEVVEVGPARFRCLHTPGHTPGSQCFLVDGSLFAGDTVFVGGCGRCDFEGGDPAQMFDSLHRVLGALPDDTRLYPGHDYGETPVSTLADERAKNPYFLRKDLDSFVAFRMRPRT